MTSFLALFGFYRMTELRWVRHGEAWPKGWKLAEDFSRLSHHGEYAALFSRTKWGRR